MIAATLLSDMPARWHRSEQPQLSRYASGTDLPAVVQEI
jgi:hypothetical protein